MSEPHPLMRALIETLPPTGALWPHADRARWFRACEAIFDLIYEEPPLALLAPDVGIPTTGPTEVGIPISAPTVVAPRAPIRPQERKPIGEQVADLIATRLPDLWPLHPEGFDAKACAAFIAEDYNRTIDGLHRLHIRGVLQFVRRIDSNAYVALPLGAALPPGVPVQLSDAQQRVFDVLLEEADARWIVRIGRKAIAERAEVVVSSVQSMVQALERKGFVSLVAQSGPHLPSTYLIEEAHRPEREAGEGPDRPFAELPPAPKRIDRAEVVRLYQVEKLPCTVIAARLTAEGTPASETAIRKHLKAAGVTPRSKSEIAREAVRTGRANPQVDGPPEGEPAVPDASIAPAARTSAEGEARAVRTVDLAPPKPRLSEEDRRDAMVLGVAKARKPAALFPPKPKPVGLVPAMVYKPVVLADLEPHQCKWPTNDPGLGRMDEALFCGKPRESEAEPYCTYHNLLALTEAGRRRREAA